MFTKIKSLKFLAWGIFLFIHILGMNSVSAVEAKAPSVFAFHLNQEPNTLNPTLTTSSSSYLLGNLFRNLYILNKNSKLELDLAESCTEINNKNQLTCTLKKNLQWSDGSAIVAQDFVDTYKWILTSENKSPRADFLFSIKNAQDYYLKKTEWKNVGVFATNNLTLKFELSSFDKNFKYKLALLNTAPAKKNPLSKNYDDQLLSSGPFKILNHDSQKSYTLIPHEPYYKSHGFKHTPPDQVIAKIISDESTALKLYEKNELQFLRRLPSSYISKYKSSSEYLSISVLRLDYFGFSQKSPLSLRKALSLSLDYKELQKIFSSEGLPGCPGLPSEWSSVEKFPCIEENLVEAKKFLKEVPAEFQKNLMLFYSQQGGEDHRRAAEWMQNQWKSKLGLSVKVQSFENKVFNEMIQSKFPTLFRKGVALDSPLCADALQIFTSKDPENFLKLNDPVYDSFVFKLKNEKKSAEEKKLCHNGIKYLLEQYLLIPTGPIHFSMLLKKNIQGLSINSLNQMDLSTVVVQP